MDVFQTIKKLSGVYPRKILPALVSFLISFSVTLFFVRMIIERTISFDYTNIQSILVFGIGVLVSWIISDVIYQNYRWYTLRLINEEVDPRSVLDLINHSSWSRLLKIVLIKDILTILASLLFIIPGIVVGYALALAPQYYLENEKSTIQQAISHSVKAMQKRGWLYVQIQLRYSWQYIIPIGLYVLFNLNNQANIQIAIDMGQDFIDLVFGMLTGILAIVLLILFVIAVFLEPKKTYMKQLLYVLTTEKGKVLEKELGEQDDAS